MANEIVPKALYDESVARAEQKERRIGELENQLKNMDYLKYCNVARNEIRKFDKYAWAATPKFQYIQEDLDYFDDFDALQEEKRRLRLIHAFNHSNENAVRDVLKKLPQGMSIETFAELLAKGYRIISEEIHKISYSVSFGSLYCPAVTSDKRVNDALNIILEDIEFWVGRMVPRPKKRKMDEGESTSNT